MGRGVWDKKGVAKYFWEATVCQSNESTRMSVCMGGLSLVGEFLDNPLGPEAEVLGEPEYGSN